MTYGPVAFSLIQIKAKELLSEEAAKVDDLKACLNMGLGIDIELPEIPLLQSVSTLVCNCPIYLSIFS